MKTHTLYRAYTRYGRLLYVGISNDYERRMGEHKNKSKWYPKAKRFYRVDGLTEKQARKKEVRAIKWELPIYNEEHRVLPRWFIWVLNWFR